MTPASAPNSPTGVTALGGNGQATITFTAFGTLQQQILLSPATPTVGYGTGVQLSEKGTSGVGTISYWLQNDGGSGCAISTSGLVSALRPGTCTVVAAIGADDAYASAVSNSATITFTGTGITAQALTLSAPSSSTTSTGTISLVTSGSLGSGALSFQVLNGSSCQVSSAGIVSASSPGVCTISATIAADPKYAAATSNTITLTFSSITHLGISTLVIQFAQGDSTVTSPSALAQIQEVAAEISSQQLTRISIKGYSDSEPPFVLGVSLGLSRAKAVAAVLSADLASLGADSVVIHVHDGGVQHYSLNSSKGRIVTISD